MRSTITYRRPAPVNKQAWGHKPGMPHGKSAGRQPRPPAQQEPRPALNLPDLKDLLRK